MALARPGALRDAIEQTFPERPFRIVFWDGGEVSATEPGGPTFAVRSPRAVAQALRAPGQLGLGRAYVSGELSVDDIDAVITLLERWKPPPLAAATRLRLIAAAARAAGLTKPPARPRAELVPKGSRHSKERDARAVRHHYDVSNEFFALFLDESMTYSCAFFSRDDTSLADAQRAKLELTADKLGIGRGDRVLDIGCGWGSFVIAAAERGAEMVVGVTLSEAQAREARQRVLAAGFADRVRIEVADYRDLAGSYDAIASIGMVEHVGAENIDLYAEQVAGLLRPGGRLLNHGITRLRHTDPKAGPFSERYVFPDADPIHLSRALLAFERAGLPARHVEEFGADYAETLRHWARRLDENVADAIRIAGEERVRVWRLYLRAARSGFEVGFTSIYQVLCQGTIAQIPSPSSIPANVSATSPPIASRS
ncbi:MAG: cyclopropane-fatty-acyl-phospholipid synthase family protein [bacterium]